MTSALWKYLLCSLLTVTLALGLFGCGVMIEEEEETEEIVETVESDQEMLSVINKNLDMLASAANHPWNEQSCIDIAPGLFEQVVAYGDRAIPYLLEIGEAYINFYQKNEDAYLKCVLAYQAAYRIDHSLFQHLLPSPDNQYTLHMVPYSFMYIGDPNIGTVYNVHLIDNQTGEEKTVVGCISSAAVLDWTSNYRYAIFCDRPHKYATSTTVTILDTTKHRGTGVNTSWMLEYYSDVLKGTCSEYDLRYQYMDNGDMIFWFGMKAEDGTVITGKIAASFALNVMHEYSYQEKDISDFYDTIPAHTGDGEPKKHYWYTGDQVWTITKDEDGYITMKTDDTIGSMIAREKEGKS